MKKNTISALLLMAGLSFGFGAYAQTPQQKEQIKKGTDSRFLQQIAKQYGEEYNAKRANAVKIAQAMNWPTEIVNDKEVSLLVDVVEGKPVYLTADNVGSAITSRTNSLQPDGDLGLNLEGTNMYVGMWDGNYPRATHSDFGGRLAVNDGSPTPDNAHPTHVLGTMIGAGVSTPTARGMAPKAFAFVYSYDNDYEEMALQADVEALLLSNHSYGYNFSALPTSWVGEYRVEARQVDEITFGAKYYTPCFSAGNDGNGTYDRLTDRTLAKNSIIVGACFEVDSYTGPESVTIAGFSSWGPTNDNRIKPDIVTKGVNVISSINTNNTAYGPNQGTSMSCPGVTGALILVQQHYSNVNYGNFMKSATLRGLVAHSADECGTTDGPDPKFGWGLLNTKKAAQIISANGSTSFIKEMVLLPGEEKTFQVLASGTEPLIATLSWTDPWANVSSGSGLGSSKALVNDLDIRVTKSGTTYFPWRLASSPSAAAVKGDNTVDNIEKVEIASPDVDWYTVTISHKGSTLQNPLGTASQEYSVIVSGITDRVGSVENVQSVNMFSVWPNPATDVVKITIDGAVAQNASASIIDVQGRVVRNAAITGAETTISTQGLSGGVYFVKVLNGTQSQVKKLAIK